MRKRKDDKRDKNIKDIKKSKENFSDTFYLSNVTERDVDGIMSRGSDIVENFPQNTPMNVMYTDANGNLSTTTDLGLQNLTVNGSISSTGGKIQEGGNDLVPKGTIVMWNGSSAPSGWALCNGTNGTPDLRDRFIVGAGNIYGVGATGGASEVKLSVEQMPSHNHITTDNGNLKLLPSGAYNAALKGSNDRSGIDRNNQELPLAKDVFSAKGGDQPHENRPPYYALCYIMKM
jgi:microcystin-dependent protein